MFSVAISFDQNQITGRPASFDFLPATPFTTTQKEPKGSGAQRSLHKMMMESGHIKFTIFLGAYFFRDEEITCKKNNSLKNTKNKNQKPGSCVSFCFVLIFRVKFFGPVSMLTCKIHGEWAQIVERPLRPCRVGRDVQRKLC